MPEEHEIIIWKKRKFYFEEDEINGGFRKEKRLFEYEYFRCKKSKRMTQLTSWDFNYCPFCGEKIK